METYFAFEAFCFQCIAKKKGTYRVWIVAHKILIVQEVIVHLNWSTCFTDVSKTSWTYSTARENITISGSVSFQWLEPGISTLLVDLYHHKSWMRTPSLVSGLVHMRVTAKMSLTNTLPPYSSIFKCDQTEPFWLISYRTNLWFLYQSYHANKSELIQGRKIRRKSFMEIKARHCIAL